MELKKAHWNLLDKTEFLNYLKTLQNPNKVDFYARTLNTRLPILAIPTPAIKKIANEIALGNYLGFLNLQIYNYFETTLLNGLLICKIKDFKLFKNKLTDYAKHVDNWACCDQLTFCVKENMAEFFKLSTKFFASKQPFKRRIGVRIWFNFILPNYLPQIFDLINKSSAIENEYYVNMAIAWFLCECYIKQPVLTTNFIQNCTLNAFVLKKFVSKCCDSYRITTQNKSWLKEKLLKTLLTKSQ